MNTAKQPLLSFCIPTFNRPKELERLLRGLADQISPEMEIVIRDDSTDDKTEGVVKKFFSGSKADYRYFHGEKIGLDAAGIFLMQEARGKYVWWFSDDDELRPGAVAKIIQILSHNPDTNFMWVNFIMDRQSAPVSKGEDGFVPASEILDRAGIGIGLLSTMLMRREAALKYIPMAKEQSIGFGFANVVQVLGSMSEPGRCYFLAGPYIQNHPTTREEIIAATTKAGTIKNDGFRVYGVVFNKVVSLFKDKLDNAAIRRLLKKNFSYLWRWMLVGYVGGWDTPKGKRWQMFKLYWDYPEFWIAIWPMLLPRAVDAHLLKFYKRLFPKTFVAK